MHSKWVILVTIISTVLLGGCGSQQLDRTPEIATITTTFATATRKGVDISMIDAGNYPRVDGSSSAYPMQVMIACTILAVPCDWTEADFFNATRRIAPVDSLLSSDERETIFNLIHNGTHAAYINLIEGYTDLILVAREPSLDELEAGGDAGVALDIRPVALDAFVFLVHVDNPVESLTLEQVRDIYAGRITNWSQVGGLEAEIHTYQRNPNSGSQELMEKLVMSGETMLDSPDMILMSMMGPFSAVRDDPLGVGYSVFFYAKNIFPDENVRMLPIAGVEPTSETIANQTYPLITEVFVVMREDTPSTQPARILRDWLLIEAGQVAVKSSGYVGKLE
jgi:phosphate transport system substrate-binding protein